MSVPKKPAWHHFLAQQTLGHDLPRLPTVRIAEGGGEEVEVHQGGFAVVPANYYSQEQAQAFLLEQTGAESELAPHRPAPGSGLVPPMVN